MEPWQVLGLREDEVGDATVVKRAYVRLLKQHRPDRDPEGFRRIRDAYETLTAQLAWRTRLGLMVEALPAAVAVAGEAVAPRAVSVAPPSPNRPPVAVAPVAASSQLVVIPAEQSDGGGDPAATSPASASSAPPDVVTPVSLPAFAAPVHPPAFAEPAPWLQPSAEPSDQAWEPPPPPPDDDTWFAQRLAEVSAGAGSQSALTEAAARLVAAATTPAARRSTADRLAEALAEHPAVLTAACSDDWLLAAWQDGGAGPLLAVIAHSATAGSAQRAEELATRLAGHPGREAEPQALLTVANALALWSPTLALRLANDAFRFLPSALRGAVERIEAHAAVGADMQGWPLALRVAVARSLDAGSLSPGVAVDIRRRLIHLPTGSPLRAALRQRLPALRQAPPDLAAAPQRSRVQLPNGVIVLLIMMALAIGRGLLRSPAAPTSSRTTDAQTEHQAMLDRVRMVIEDGERRRRERQADDARRGEAALRSAEETQAAAAFALAAARRQRAAATIAILVTLPAAERRTRIDALVAGASPGMHRGGVEHRGLLLALAGSIALADDERVLAARALAATGDTAALAELAARDDLPDAVRESLRLPVEAPPP